MPCLRWSVEAYVPTLHSAGPQFETEPLRYWELYVTGEDLTTALCANAKGHWPEDAFVEDDRVYLGTINVGGVGRVGRERHELVHGAKLRFTLVADEQPPPAAWGSWKLRRFEPFKDEPTEPDE